MDAQTKPLAPAHQPEDRTAMKVVAVVGHANDWAAYKGPSDWSDDDVARNGDKIGEEEAKRLFYSLGHSDLVYRW